MSSLLPSSEIPAGISIKPRKFSIALTEKEAVPEPGADPAEQRGLDEIPGISPLVLEEEWAVQIPVQDPGEPPGAGRTGRAARSHLLGMTPLNPAALLLPPLPAFSPGSGQQISAGGKRHVLSQLGTLVSHCSGAEPVPAPGNAAPRWMERPGEGIRSLPEQGRLIPCTIRKDSVLPVLIPPPFLWRWH